jgi:hypothetical protein
VLHSDIAARTSIDSCDGRALFIEGYAATIPGLASYLRIDERELQAFSLLPTPIERCLSRA